MDNYIIYPYVGVGQLQFGMSRNKVAELMGVPDDVDIDAVEKEVTEYRHDSRITLVYSLDDDKLIEIGFGPNIKNLVFNNIRMFCENPEIVIKNLMTFDDKPFEHVGFIVFFELGITLAGIFDRDDSDKAITVFNKGRWDFMKQKMKRYVLKT